VAFPASPTASQKLLESPGSIAPRGYQAAAGNSRD
jgi:hypothetical protein